MIARFFSHVARDASGCWLWTGGLTHNGYGQFSIGRRKIRAHRFAYELFIGPIADGYEIDHVKARGCFFRNCVHPAHLEQVTSAVNTSRGDSPSARNARKTHCARGHELAGTNLHVRPDGRRRCRACEAARVARFRARELGIEEAA